MKHTTEIITRYAKVSSTSELKREYNHSYEKGDLANCKPACTNFYNHFFQACKFDNAIFYPVRVANVYVLTIREKSYLFSSAEQLYKKLVYRDIVHPSDELRHLFETYELINFQKISELTGCTLVKLPIYSYMTDETDVFERCSGKGRMTYIPCLFEDKMVREFWIQTNLLTPGLTKQFKKYHRFTKISDAFFVPQEALEEMFEDLPFSI